MANRRRKIGGRENAVGAERAVVDVSGGGWVCRRGSELNVVARDHRLRERDVDGDAMLALAEQDDVQARRDDTRCGVDGDLFVKRHRPVGLMEHEIAIGLDAKDKGGGEIGAFEDPRGVGGGDDLGGGFGGWSVQAPGSSRLSPTGLMRDESAHVASVPRSATPPTMVHCVVPGMPLNFDHITTTAMNASVNPTKSAGTQPDDSPEPRIDMHSAYVSNSRSV